MALQMQQYKLFGFSQELDWRPLRFAEPIPAYRICDACGLVPRTIVGLPCRHVLCKACYEQCLNVDARGCPLDGEQFCEDVADWRDFPVENLLRRKVKCWNEENGCDAIMDASDLSKHFDEDCDHHSTRCPKCSAFVLCRSVCAHRRSNCSTHALPNRAQQLKTLPDSIQEVTFTDLKTTLEESVAEMRSGVDHLVREHNIHFDTLDEISHTVNALREAVIEASNKQTHYTDEARIATVREVKEDLAAKGDKLDEIAHRIDALGANVKLLAAEAARQCIEKQEQSNDELRRLFSADDRRLERVSEIVSSFEGVLGKALERATEAIVEKCKTNADLCAASEAAERKNGQDASAAGESENFALDTPGITQTAFHVKGINALKEAAILRGYAEEFRDPVYLCGYCVSLGLYLKRNEGSVSAHALLRLHKGMIDEFLPWPFCHDIKLTFMHSSPAKNHESIVHSNPLSLNHYGRPTGSANRGAYFGHSAFPLEDLQREGYIKSDELWLKYELFLKTK